MLVQSCFFAIVVSLSIVCAPNHFTYRVVNARAKDEKGNVNEVMRLGSLHPYAERRLQLRSDKGKAPKGGIVPLKTAVPFE